MNYQNINNQAVRTYAEIKTLNRHISYPKAGTAMLGDEWKLIAITDKPVFDELTQGVIEIAPVNFTQTWEVYTLTAQESQVKLDKKLIVDTKAWKTDREKLVEAIEVIYNTVIYQGDETSQTRMARAIIGLADDIVTIDWVAKDNSVNALTRIDLQAILLDAGTQQSVLWSIGRPM